MFYKPTTYFVPYNISHAELNCFANDRPYKALKACRIIVQVVAYKPVVGNLFGSGAKNCFPAAWRANRNEMLALQPFVHNSQPGGEGVGGGVKLNFLSWRAKPGRHWRAKKVAGGPKKFGWRAKPEKYWRAKKTRWQAKLGPRARGCRPLL